MRVAIGEFAHETNTFCPGLTETERFHARHWQEGGDLLAGHRGVRDPLGGMLAAGERLGVEIVPTFATSAEPSATISRRAYETIRDELIGAIRAAGPVDAICLSLHGAGSAEGIDDLEGTFLGELREAVGREVPITVTLDLHGHTTEAMVEHADALLYCHEYPHVDGYERGEEALELAVRIVNGEVRPVMHLEKLRMVLPPSTTRHGTARAINEMCFGWEAKPGMIDCALAHGFPHTDVPIVATTVLATADGDADLAREAAQDVARRVWEMRGEFLQELPGADEAVRLALAAEARPVVIAEVSDNPGGGAPGDGTHLLRALLAADAEGSCFGFVYDPEVARQAHEAGVGTTIGVRLGGKTDDLHGAPIETQAYVKCLTDGRFRYSTPMGAGRQVDLGPMARLVIGNVDVLVSSVRTQTLDAEVFGLHGIDVTRSRIVALKSHQHFRAGFEPLAGTIIRCDTPGLTTSNLGQLPFRRIARPIWPLDEVS
ncbi:MAG: M81 family metallopeptidase [Chloroflexota bacterium]|nr:M81 family metallopeptidase [Chloroflexota bacterium]